MGGWRSSWGVACRLKLVVKSREGKVPTEWLSTLRESNSGCGVRSGLRDVGLEDGLVDMSSASLPPGRRNSSSHGSLLNEHAT